MEVESNEEVLGEEVLELEKEPQEPEIDLEARVKKLEGINNRLKTRLDKMKNATDTEPVKEATKEKEVGKLGETELMYLETKGIEDEEQLEFIQRFMNRNGESARTAIKDPYVKSHLKLLKEKKDVAAATPTSPKHIGSSSSRKDSVDYWLKKGGVPEDLALARKVVNARIEAEKNGDKFAKDSLISNIGQDI